MKKAIILCSLDGYANSLKPRELKRFLEKNGYSAELYSTLNISRFREKGVLRFFPKIKFPHLTLYCLEAIHFIAKRSSREMRTSLISFTARHMVRLRGKILHEELATQSFDLLICENNYDESIVLGRVAKTQILDLPTPFAEELFYGNEINKEEFAAFCNYEREIYAKADFISFHWPTYSELVKREKYNGNNFISIGFGTEVRNKRAKYGNPPRVVFIGYLGGYWSNMPLLESLSKVYPYIDVYGGPAISYPHINYKGITKDSEILAQYQFGLITITDDHLRRAGFSAKHLDYFSYGLPVLVPAWRSDSLLASGSISFTVENFVSQIKAYSSEQAWKEKSDAALRIAEELRWDNIFGPLKAALEKRD